MQGKQTLDYAVVIAGFGYSPDGQTATHLMRNKYWDKNKLSACDCKLIVGTLGTSCAAYTQGAVR